MSIRVSLYSFLDTRSHVWPKKGENTSLNFQCVVLTNPFFYIYLFFKTIRLRRVQIDLQLDYEIWLSLVIIIHVRGKGLEFDSKTDINIQTVLHSQSKIGFMYSCFIHKKEDG